jgi:hypothetical protein
LGDNKTGISEGILLMTEDEEGTAFDYRDDFGKEWKRTKKQVEKETQEKLEDEKSY